MMVVNNKVVAIEYELMNRQGELLDYNKGFSPVEYLHGAGNIVSGLEKALEGLCINETARVTVPPDLGYGLCDNTVVHRLPVKEYSGSGFTNVEDIIQLADGREAVIISKNENYLIADANHPLAGQTLYYNVTIKNIREATMEEIACGHPLQEKIYCSGTPGCC